MAKDFAFLFYVNDWAGGTQWLTRLQRGAYLDLLLHQVNNTSLTNEDVKCILGSDYDLTWPVLKSKFVENNGIFYNDKMRNVLESRKKFTDSRRENRLGKHKNKTRKTLVKLVGNENENEKEDIIITEKEGIEEPLFDKLKEFYTFRKQIKKPIVEASRKAFQSKLLKLSNGNKETAIAILEQSIANGWVGIFELKTTNTQTNGKQISKYYN